MSDKEVTIKLDRKLAEDLMTALLMLSYQIELERVLRGPQRVSDDSHRLALDRVHDIFFQLNDWIREDNKEYDRVWRKRQDQQEPEGRSQ